MSVPAPNPPAISRHRLTAKHKIWHGLSIYQTGASPYWFARFWDRAAKRYVVRSTKETLKRDAILAAETMVKKDALTAPPRAVEVIIAIDPKDTFAHWAEAAMAVNRAKGKKFALRDDLKLLNRPDNGLLEYFGPRDISTITSTEITDYFLALDEAREAPLAASTKAKHVILLNKVFKAAANEGKLSRLPAINSFSIDQSPRPSFSDEEYKKLLQVAKDCVRKGDTIREKPMTMATYYMIGFMVSSFLRPVRTELFGLKHGAITKRADPDALELKIDGKTKKRVSVTLPSAVSIYDNIVKLTEYRKPSDYVFYPDEENRSVAMAIARLEFNHILDKAKLKLDFRGDARTLYSLRHYSLQSRLRKSGGQVNVYTLARNAGTSVEMLQRFYLKDMSLSDDMIRNLHSTKDTA